MYSFHVDELTGFYRCALCGAVPAVVAYRDETRGLSVVELRCCGFRRRATCNDATAATRGLREVIYGQLGPRNFLEGYEWHHLETDFDAALRERSYSGWASG